VTSDPDFKVTTFFEVEYRKSYYFTLIGNYAIGMVLFCDLD